MPVRRLGVWLDGLQVAELQSPHDGRITCRYRSEALDAWRGNSPLLSCSLPLRTGRQDAWAFTTGLLPEGQHRQSMAALARVTTLDVMGMLARFGRDVAGAVIISPADPPLRNAGVAPYTPERLALEVGALDENPLGLHDDSELSIAGLQDKMLLVEVSPGTWGRPRNGYPSTHVLKVDDRFHSGGLVRAEHACLRLAAAAGLRSSGSQLLRVGDSECVIVQRFDRRIDSTGKIVPVHQEDACQALGIDPEHNQRKAKYEAFGGPSLLAVANLLNAWAADPEAELQHLLDLAVFTVLIGNADAHGKNLGLMHPQPDVIELAPLYDLVPTMIWPNLKTDAAMTIGGQVKLPRVGLSHVVAEAARWSFSPDRARARAVEVAELVREVLRAGKVDVDTPALAAIAERTDRFLLSA